MIVNKKIPTPPPPSYDMTELSMAELVVIEVALANVDATMVANKMNIPNELVCTHISRLLAAIRSSK